MSTRLQIGLLLLNCSFPAFTETIYQWSDPWGQIQYSKTPVAGAMISDLTQLPEQTATTEQQKQEAMVRKLQEMKQRNSLRSQNAATQLKSNEQSLQTKNYCRQLRILLADLQARSLWQQSLFNIPLLPGYYGPIHSELSRELRQNCR
ncbi:MAG: hypothetical protein H6940_01105 [Burkholderiales bacterium]|uniref:DUF4124 domain-containing protein n=1 Tax=Nitrosomonas sp. TaxID=42353 RepID=UPI001D7BCAC1|nr:DUF4124 domain-containing protein [Nitrosomonas sp.]MCB1949472.1 hypothetical protein [Nitrosomonas sp.]MCP5242027.1 hypothetical protein [Burkholderiales bacterium]